jgi:predicted enzyme related to lactoylglutathione lyase
MTELKSYPPGDFCWTELATSDWKKAAQFYKSLLGWTTNEMPMGPDQPPYVMVEKNGKRVAAIYENKKARPAWLSYVCVANADETAKKAKSLGGRLLQEPFDVFDVGRMATIQDLQGATFAIWQPKKHIGAEVINEPGTMCWNELSTNDIESARKFYTGLFGWKLKISPGYTEARVGEVATAGMHDMAKEMPPFWMPYFAVTDCQASTKTAKSLGARTYKENTDVPEVGRFTLMADPLGGTFAVIELIREPAMASKK